MCKEQAIGIDSPSGDRDADLALARRAAAGEDDALHCLVDRHADALFRLARRLCPTVADAEDVVQETLLDTCRGIGGYDGRASLLSWMSRILFRRAGKAFRKRGRAPVVNDEWVGRVANSESHREASDSKLDLATALDRLGTEHRDVIVLRELQGMSYADIAHALNIPQGTVESRLFRARAELRRLLSDYDFTS